MSTGSVVRRIAVQALGFLVAGALAGVLWQAVWQAPDGVVFRGDWFFDPAGPDVAFTGAALYVAIAVPVGLALGISAGLLKGREMVTTVTVLLASAVAAVVMYAVGHTLGPSDPRVLAEDAEDFAAVPAALVLNPEPGRRPWASTALVALPVGALGGLSATFLVVPGRRRVRAAADDGVEVSGGSAQSVSL